MSTVEYTLAISLTTKGSINNLHRQDVVDAFRRRGVKVLYLVRRDYAGVMLPLTGARYLEVSLPELSPAWRRYLCTVMQLTRSFYPTGAIGRRKGGEYSIGLRRRTLQGVLRVLAKSRFLMALLLLLERRLLRTDGHTVLDGYGIDQLLVSGIGGHGGETEARLGHWASCNGISVVNLIGNWDALTSKGYRGMDIGHLLVWGPAMAEDAWRLHRITQRKVSQIGSIRYDRLRITYGREEFLKGMGLKPDHRTILFAGPVGVAHYFEMLDVFARLKRLEEGKNIQLVVRFYPDKSLLNSSYFQSIRAYANQAEDVHLSIGDPNFEKGDSSKDVLQFEQDELWHYLAYSDLVINVFSTMALEGCRFDIPAVHMAYQPDYRGTWLKPPSFPRLETLPHNARLIGYGAVDVATSREQLIGIVSRILAGGDSRRAQRKLAVTRELGQLDGEVLDRLIDRCITVHGEYLGNQPLAGRGNFLPSGSGGQHGSG